MIHAQLILWTGCIVCWIIQLLMLFLLRFKIARRLVITVVRLRFQTNMDAKQVNVLLAESSALRVLWPRKSIRLSAIRADIPAVTQVTAVERIRGRNSFLPVILVFLRQRNDALEIECRSCVWSYFVPLILLQMSGLLFLSVGSGGANAVGGFLTALLAVFSFWGMNFYARRGAGKILEVLR